jgi:Ca-activated chloride channel homolog
MDGVRSSDIFGRFTVVLVLVLSAVGIAPNSTRVSYAQRTAPPPPGVLRVQTNLQSLAIRVTDKQGNDVKGLTPADFTILEDGRPQKISFFGTDNVPTTLNVLVDASGTMDPSGRLGSAEAIAARFLRSGRPDDEISAMEFTDEMGPFRLLTQQQLRDPSSAVLSPGISKGSALFDAIATVLCHLKASKNLRQAIMVISDGVDQHSRLSLEQLIGLVQSSRAQLFMIGSNSRPEFHLNGHPESKVRLVSGHDIDNPAVVFDRLTKESGAEAFFPTSEDGLEQALKKVSDLLEAQFTIAYYPQDNVKGFRRIQVRMRRPGLVVTVRRGVGSATVAGAPNDFTEGTCLVSPSVHPYPYDSRVTQTSDGTSYREDFSDVGSGWPNREESRYMSGGYELSNTGASKIDIPPGFNTFLGGFSFGLPHDVVAAYGPWWTDFRESAVLDSVPVFPKSTTPNSITTDWAAAGFAFRLNDRGYYALLLAGSRKAKDVWFKVEKFEYQRYVQTDIIPWTAAHSSEAPASGLLLTADCVGNQITILLNNQQVARAQDDSYGQGYVGFVLSGTGRARFRNLVVTQR